MSLDVTNIFETNDIRKLFISLITSGIEKRQRAYSQGSFKVYVYKEDGGQHHYQHCHLYMNEFSLVFNLENESIIESTFKNTKIEKIASEIILKNKRKIIEIYERVNL